MARIWVGNGITEVYELVELNVLPTREYSLAVLERSCVSSSKDKDMWVCIIYKALK